MAKERLEIPAVAMMDNIVFSKDEVWAYYKINTVPFDFLDFSSQAHLGLTTSSALSALVSSEGKQVDCHIIMTNFPFNVDSWEEQMLKKYDEWNSDLERSREFVNFIDTQADELRYGGYQKRVTYLGVKLFTRGAFTLDNFNALEFGFKDAWQLIKKMVDTMLSAPAEIPMEKEERRAQSEEEEIYRILKGGDLQVSRPTAEELLLVTKMKLHPAMPAPYLDINLNERVGMNDINRETVSVIQNNFRNLKINQIVDGEEYEGYRATLSFTEFPTHGMGLPGAIPPFLYFPSMRRMPFDMNARFTLIPPSEARRDLEKKKMEAEDEGKNLQMAGYSSPHFAKVQQEIRTMELELEERTPWVSGSYRITIEMPTEELLSDAISEVKQMYAQDDIILTLTSGDQLDLLLEELPGGKLLMPSFNQMTNIAMVGTSGFNFGGDAGDPIDEKVVLSKGGNKYE